MGNHLHSILCTQPQLALSWSEDEVACRWRRLFPRRRKSDGSPEEPNEYEIREITSDPKLLDRYRKRLCNLSWFHRCLNEHIARLANAEDDCTGRFWEGRFKSIRLESEGAVLGCSVYVDLNPVRAGIAKSLEASSFTSIQDRILNLANPGSVKGPRLIPHELVTFPGFSLENYIRLVEETGKMLVDKKHSLPPDLVSVLERLKLRPEKWLENAKNQRKLFRRIVGPVEAIKQLALQKQKAWFHGISAAKQLFL